MGHFQLKQKDHKKKITIFCTYIVRSMWGKAFVIIHFLWFLVYIFSFRFLVLNTTLFIYHRFFFTISQIFSQFLLLIFYDVFMLQWFFFFRFRWFFMFGLWHLRPRCSSVMCRFWKWKFIRLILMGVIENYVMEWPLCFQNYTPFNIDKKL